MKNITVGQRFFSESEMHLGVGKVRLVEFKNITLDFPAVSETRIYRSANSLERYILDVGEIVKNEKGNITFPITEIKEENGLLVYYGRAGKKLKESEISSKLIFKPSNYFKALSESKVYSTEEYRLRMAAHEIATKWNASQVKGMIGPRVDMVPHQFYLCARACNNSKLPRLMLSDEVGLGKTIEAGMIWHTLHIRNRITRTLILLPESLKNQWVVEMKRRFNQVFTLVDAAFLKSIQDTSDRDSIDDISKVHMKINPFLAANNIICTMEFLMQNPPLQKDLKSVDWDLMIVDEAHHLQCEDDWVSKEYQTVYELVSKTKGLLLLTGTPLQLNPESHFHRLQMLDPVRFYDYGKFLEEQEFYKKLALDLSKLPDNPNEKLSYDALKKILPKNSPIRVWLEKETEQELEANEWIYRIVDALGTGSLVFRNTRKGVGGFPKRVLKAVPLKPDSTYQKIVQMLALKDEERATDYYIQGTLFCQTPQIWEKDERIVWLKKFLKQNKKEKVLLITETEQVLKAIATELSKEFETDFFTCFFEQMSILDRDKASANFAREDGATILLSTEIGSEGRNFQCAHQIILWDLPLDATLVEQRIGRLDRIGQKQDIEIYVPYVLKTAQEIMFRWYHEGLDAFTEPRTTGSEFFIKYTEVLLQTILDVDTCYDDFCKKFIPKLNKEVKAVRLAAESGRDKLLEFNSRNPEATKSIIDAIERIDKDKSIVDFVVKVLHKQGVEAEPGALPETILFTQNEQVEKGSVPGMPSMENTLLMTEEATTETSLLTVSPSRTRAMMHDSVDFLSIEHPLVQGAIDFATRSLNGGVSCVLWNDSGLSGAMLMEYTFVIDFSVSPEWGLDSIAYPRYIASILNGSGEYHNELEEKLKTASFKDVPVPQGKPAVTAKLNYFASEGFNLAKKDVQEKSSEIVNNVSRAIEDKLTKEYLRTKHLLALRGSSENSDELLEMKKNIAERKKYVEKPSVRLDAIRLIVCR